MKGAATALVLLAASLDPCLAVQVHTRTATIEELKKGAQEGVSVSTRGRLAPTPALERLGSAEIPGGAAHVWAVASDAAGNVFLGTGPDGRIVRVAPGGAEKVVFTVADPIVTALAVTANGDLLAGTGPSGRIWRIQPDGSGSVWCETGERYVWSLLVARDGSVFAGTGEEGLVLRIHRSGTGRGRLPFPVRVVKRLRLTTRCWNQVTTTTASVSAMAMPAAAFGWGSPAMSRSTYRPEGSRRSSSSRSGNWVAPHPRAPSLPVKPRRRSGTPPRPGPSSSTCATRGRRRIEAGMQYGVKP